jgi:uncharacterized RDD family membrane protein YckC
VGATLIDGILVGIPLGIILASTSINSFYGRNALGELFSLIYVTLMLGYAGGQTLGNKALGTRVADVRHGGPPDMGKAFVRQLVQVVLNFTVIGGFLDILWPLWDSQNQTLHDKAAGTVVLRTR